MENKEEKTLQQEVKEKVEKSIKNILKDGIQTTNVDNLYKLVDIHKDMTNEEYWKENKDMRNEYGNYNEGNYGEYGTYGRRGVAGTGRRSYRAGDNYGRRGVDSKYRGEELLDDMYQGYQEYNYGRENYGADKQTLESFKYMVKSFKDYYKHLKQNASSQEEMQILEQAINEMANM